MAVQPADTAAIKRRNVSAVRRAIIALGSVTKAEVAGLTGLSVATSNTIFNQMLEGGELELVGDEGSASRGAGRPAARYRLNERQRLSLALRLSVQGRTRSLDCELCDILGRPLDRRRLPLSFVDAALLGGFIAEIRGLFPAVAAVGLSVPGTVDEQGNIGVCDADELSGCRLAERLAGMSGLPVSVDNELGLAALGLGLAAQGRASAESSAAITFRTGSCAAAGIAFGGNILRGQTGFAGEVSFLPISGASQRGFPGVEAAACMAASIAAVVNPARLALTGNALEPTQVEAVKRRLGELLPYPHRPELVYLTDPSELQLAALRERNINLLI